MPRHGSGNQNPPDGLEGQSSLGDSFESTETIDLSNLFTRDLSSSGSFNLGRMRGTTFGRLLNAIPIPAGLVGNDYRFTYCNEAWQRFATDPAKMEGRSLLRLFSTSPQGTNVRSTMDEVYKHRRSLVREYQIRTNKRPAWVRVCFRPLRFGAARFVLVTFEDLTLEKEKVRLFKAIERAKKEWELTVDSVSDLIAIVDDDFRILRANKAMGAVSGLAIRDVIGRHCFELVHRTEGPPSYCPVMKCRSEGGEISEDYYETALSAYFRETARVVHGNSEGGFRHVITIRDVTEQRRAEEELLKRANTDELTGLFNRRHLEDVLTQACARARRYGHTLSIAMLDLDNLKRINDTHGHEGGDRILEWVGGVLGRELRESDFAGRYGGDEFVIGFPHISTQEAVKCVARILSYMQRNPFRIGTETHIVSCSAGISGFFSPEMTPDELIGQADRALYAAKREGRNRIAFEQENRQISVLEMGSTDGADGY